MSSDLPTDGPSSAADRPTVDHGLADLVRLRGEPLLEALEIRVPGSLRHADGTGSYAFAAAAGLGLHRAEAELCRQTARLHDIGNVYVPLELLTRDPAGLDTTERATVDAHHEAGARLALGAGVPEGVCEWILNMREHYDGTGPDGLAGGDIPIAARVGRAGCACDLALMSHAAGGAHPDTVRAAVIRDLGERAGTELDPTTVESLARVLQRSA